MLRPVAREAAHPRSISAVHGLDAQPLHTDGAHLPEPPGMVLLACQDANSTATLLWDSRGPAARSAPRRALEHGMFLVHNRQDSFFAPAVVGREHRFDPVCMTPCDSRAHAAAAYLAEQIGRSERHVWSSDEVLLIDNRHVLHARAAVAEADEDRALTRIAFETGGDW
jgi:alpha-ketoglutarate-dependent taurine dioxygenase